MKDISKMKKAGVVSYFLGNIMKFSTVYTNGKKYFAYNPTKSGGPMEEVVKVDDQFHFAE